MCSCSEFFRYQKCSRVHTKAIKLVGSNTSLRSLFRFIFTSEHIRKAKRMPCLKTTITKPYNKLQKSTNIHLSILWNQIRDRMILSCA